MYIAQHLPLRCTILCYYIFMEDHTKHIWPSNAPMFGRTTDELMFLSDELVNKLHTEITTAAGTVSGYLENTGEKGNTVEQIHIPAPTPKQRA